MTIDQKVYYKLIIPISSDGYLVGDLGLVPSNMNKNRMGLVILLHGLMNTKESRTILGIERGLRGGLATFKFDFTGHGQSSGITSYSDYDQQVNDVKAVVNYFNTNKISVAEGKVETQAIDKDQETGAIKFDVKLLIGHSKGGTVAMLYSSSPDVAPIPYAINVSGRYNLTEKSLHRFNSDQLQAIQSQSSVVWQTTKVGREVFLTQNCFPWRDQFNVNTFNSINTLNHVKKILTIHGTGDKIVPSEDAEKFHQALKSSGKHELNLLQEVSHFFNTELEMSSLLEAINFWMASQEYLVPDI